MKQCDKCNLNKELTEFDKLARNKDGYNHTCKLCVSVISKFKRDEYNANSKFKEMERELNDLKKKYKLKCKMYNALKNNQLAK